MSNTGTGSISLPPGHISEGFKLTIIIGTYISSVFYGLYMYEKSRKKKPNQLTIGSWNYSKIKDLIRNSQIALPAMFVDLNQFDANAQTLLDMVRGSGKTLRIATKSIRCPALIKRVLELDSECIKGLMCYSVDEAEFWSKEGFDDFFVAYPTLQRKDIETTMKMLSQGFRVTLTIDCVEHVNILDTLSSACCTSEKIRVAIDLDTSYKLFSRLIQLGAHRSQVDSVERFAEIVTAIKNSFNVQLVGAMGYEAHVAGLPDNQPPGYSSIPGFFIRYLKSLFYEHTKSFRKEIAEYCKANDVELEFFNGGGTGTLAEVCCDSSVTEVTAGSGFLQAQLFDYYMNNKCFPALCFALQATRVNQNYITCQSGGFVASGSCNKDKFPKPFNNPMDLEHYDDEGYGEVQTPLYIRNDLYPSGVYPGDPVLFRPAKSGEIAEHFNDYHLLRNYFILETAKTYRGLGHAFH